MAMAPTVVKAACRGDPVGHGHAEVARDPVELGVQGVLLPAQATRWPMVRSSTPAPTSTTSPHSE